MPKTFGEFVALLISLGPKVKKVWPQLVLVYQTVVAIVGEFVPTTDAATMMSAADVELEAQLQSLLVAEGVITPEISVKAIGDGSLIRAAWGFMEKHPAIKQIIIGLITSAIAG